VSGCLAKTGSYPPSRSGVALTDTDAQENSPSQGPQPNPNGGFFFRAVSDQAAIVSSAWTAGSIDDNRASSATIVTLRFSRRATSVLASIG
jgi:hypothetical protein